VIGSYTFTATSSIEPVIMRPAIVAKLLGGNRSAITNLGAYGAIPWHFRGMLKGSTGRADLWLIVDELNRPEPVLIQVDMLGASVSGLGYVLSIRPVEPAGYVYGTNYNYPLDIVFVQSHRSDEADLGVQYGVVQEDDAFILTGDIVVPLPVGATSPSETVTFSRYADNGAAGTNTIPCVVAASPIISKVTYTCTEANRIKNKVALTRSGKEYVLSNGLVKLQTRHGEAGTLGYVELWYYNGTAWVDAGRLRGWVSKSAGSLQEITSSTVGSEVWPVFSGDPNRQGLRLLYPATGTDSLQATMELELERGRSM